MPKLPNKEIAAEHVDGSKYHAVVECAVNESGEFSISVPEDIMDIAKKRTRIGGAHCGQSRSNAAYRVYAKSLGEALNFLRTCAEEHLQAKTVTERVIVYNLDLRVSAWLGSDNRLHPNGSLDHRNEGGRWWKPKTQEDSLHANSGTKAFTVGIGAKVFDKITTVRTSGNKVRYVEVRGEGHADTGIDEAIRVLNGFNCVHITPSEWADRNKEMPYTPQAAQFFSNVMLGLAQLGMNIDNFFADKERLMLAIEKGGPNLLGFSNERKTSKG